VRIDHPHRQALIAQREGNDAVLEDDARRDHPEDLRRELELGDLHEHDLTAVRWRCRRAPGSDARRR